MGKTRNTLTEIAELLDELEAELEDARQELQDALDTLWRVETKFRNIHSLGSEEDLEEALDRAWAEHLPAINEAWEAIKATEAKIKSAWD